MTLPLKVILTIPLECCHARRSRHLVSVKIENLLIILSFFFVTFWICSLVSEIFQNFEKSLLQLRNPIYSTPNLLFPGHNISPRDSPMPAKYFLKVHKELDKLGKSDDCRIWKCANKWSMSGIGFHSFYISGLIRPENRPQYQTLLGTGRFLLVQLTSCYVFT